MRSTSRGPCANLPPPPPPPGEAANDTDVDPVTDAVGVESAAPPAPPAACSGGDDGGENDDDREGHGDGADGDAVTLPLPWLLPWFARPSRGITLKMTGMYSADSLEE